MHEAGEAEAAGEAGEAGGVLVQPENADDEAVRGDPMGPAGAGGGSQASPARTRREFDPDTAATPSRQAEVS